MSIWFRPITIAEISERSKGTLSEFLGIEFTEITNNTISAIMPVTQNLKQPAGIVHGGANVVLAETIASTAANYAVDLENYYCVGLEINANHIKAVTKGIISAITKPIHIGKTTQIWEIELRNSEQEITCISRMTAYVIKRK